MSVDEVAIVDDDDQWVESAARALREEGYAVRPATDAEQGRDLLARTKARLVVIDLEPASFSSLHLLAEFRRWNVEAPVVVVSADDRSSIRDEALAHGANGFLRKPCTPEQMVAAARRFLPPSAMPVQ